jgi:alkylhydroperoxidase family enzyme
LGDKALVAAVLDDYTTAPIPDKERTLFAFIAKVVEDSTSITADDLACAREAGWSDEALYDAITVCALFQFYNTWIDATGVSDMPAAGYEMSGKRLAEYGYAYAEDAR